MNIQRLLTCLCALGLTTVAPTGRAQAVPDYIDYQGTVFDNSGKPLGSTGTDPDFTANPTNYTMQFRIWSSVQGGTKPVWAETQTVTVSLGTFSVRLGSGAPIADEPTGPISDSFDTKDRYLGVTVIFPSATEVEEITPRLAFQSSPFAFVAKEAKSVDGIVNARTGSQFAPGIIPGTALINASIPATALATDAVTSESIKDGAIKFTDLDSTIFSWNRSLDGNGYTTRAIGLGTESPLALLHLAGHRELMLVQGALSGAECSASITFKDVGRNLIGSIGDLSGSDSDISVQAIQGNVVLKVGDTNALTASADNVSIASKLMVNGKEPAVGEESLRIVRGSVLSTGIVSSSGLGFTSQRDGTGVYTITFTPQFADTPTVTANVLGRDATDQYLVVIDSKTRSSVTLRTFRSELRDQNFEFIAIGPR